MLRITTTLLAAAMLAAPAIAQDSFSGAGATSEMDCNGDSAHIEGASNTTRVTGACRLLVIEGAGNRVTVDMAKGGTIRITGASNEVHWRTPDGSRPRVAVSGAGNRIVKAN